MTNAWQTNETRLAALLERPIPREDKSVARDARHAAAREQEWVVTDNAAPPLAAHIVASRAWYTHHGIYVGDGKVVHYRGLSRGWRAGPVEEVSLAEFARGRPVRVRPHGTSRFDRDVVIARARSRLCEDAYRVLSNNCEHFCEWCVHGRNRSRQIEELRARPRRALLAALGLLLPGIRRVPAPGMTD
jgi:Lecithin retinol acyltransferase